jgi:enoyl-CoA hydratase/carnithine racemase
MIEIEGAGAVRIIRMSNGENRFNRESVDILHARLDEIESLPPPVALVTTGAGKFFSNGLDLDWMASAGDDSGPMLRDVQRLFGRLLRFPAITVAALNGHAFAAGAMFATAHDFAVMRQDRGYWCIPEVDLGLPLTGAMYGLLAAKLPHPTLHEAILTGRRYDAAAALAAGVIQHAVPEEQVLETAVELAASLAAKDRTVLIDHKRRMYAEAATLCAGR